MRSAVFAFLLLFIPAVPFSSSSAEEVKAGVTISDDGIKAFHLAIGDHFRVAYRDVVTAHDRKVPDEELPVVFFIAEQAGAAPGAIINARLKGNSWINVSISLGLDASVFYVPVNCKPGPPYGNAYGHYKNKKKDQWREIELTDPDIINLVNLRFISEQYGYAPEEVMKMREKGEAFVRINGEVKKAREKQAQALLGEEEKAKSSKGKDNSKSKGKKKK